MPLGILLPKVTNFYIGLIQIYRVKKAADYASKLAPSAPSTWGRCVGNWIFLVVTSICCARNRLRLWCWVRFCFWQDGSWFPS